MRCGPFTSLRCANFRMLTFIERGRWLRSTRNIGNLVRTVIESAAPSQDCHKNVLHTGSALHGLPSKERRQTHWDCPCGRRGYNVIARTSSTAGSARAEVEPPTCGCGLTIGLPRLQRETLLLKVLAHLLYRLCRLRGSTTSVVQRQSPNQLIWLCCASRSTGQNATRQLRRLKGILWSLLAC